MNALAPPPDRPPRRREAADPKPWLLLFLAGFAVRALVVWLTQGTRAHPGPESAVYDGIAWSLAQRTGFSLPDPTGLHPTASVPPLVPWLTGILYRAAGHSFFAALLLQCAIGALVPLFLVSLGGMIFGLGTGRLAARLAVVDPLAVLFTGSLAPESTFAAVLLMALLASANWVKTPRRGRALGAGVLWGVAILARPGAALLPAAVIAWAWTPLGLTSVPRERRIQNLLLVLGLVVALSPWIVRNAVVLHAFVPGTTGGGAALLAGNNPAAWGDPLLRGGAAPAPGAPARGGEVAADLDAAGRALRFSFAHLPAWPGIAAAKSARFWQPGVDARDLALLPPSPALRAGVNGLLVAWSALLDVAALWGIARTLRGARRWFQSLPLLAVLCAWALALVFWGGPRLRLPAEPALLLFAAAGLEDLRHRARARTRGLRVIVGRNEGAPGGRRGGATSG